MSALQARLSATPQGIQAASDYQPFARDRLESQVWRYLDEGSGQGLSLKANATAFEQACLIPRPLANVRGGHTRLQLFGQTFDHPLLLAPVAYQRLFHPDGEQASAMAAAAQGGQMVVSSLASQGLEEIIEAAGQPLWFQIYWQGDRPRTLKLVQRAIAAGYRVMMLTVDEPAIPMPPLLSGQSMVFDGWMTQAPTWEDLAWLRDQLDMPLLVKGLLHPEDASRAMTLGCEGVVVSNHGGRVLDGAPASLVVLPDIIEAVAGRGKVLFDSGIRNGRHAFKALESGACAVMVGRPYIWGLATCGALGVAHVVRLMRDELEMTMALCGCTCLDDVRSSGA